MAHMAHAIRKARLLDDYQGALEGRASAARNRMQNVCGLCMIVRVIIYVKFFAFRCLNCRTSPLLTPSFYILKGILHVI